MYLSIGIGIYLAYEDWDDDKQDEPLSTALFLIFAGAPLMAYHLYLKYKYI